MGARHRSVLALIAGVLVAATAVGAAQATPPTRETEPPFSIDNSSVFCGFPLRVETLQDDGVTVKTFSDGRQTVSGSRKVRLTNLASGESLVLPDAGHLVTNPERTAETFSGRTVLFLFPGEPFGPGAWLFVGRVVATFAEPGGFLYSALEVKGKRVDLCAALRD
jgi:hypothetical protein